MSSFRSFVVSAAPASFCSFGRKASHIDNPGDMGVTGSHFLPAVGDLGGFYRHTVRV